MWEIANWEGPARERGQIKSNFSALLLSLERAFADDADLDRELSALNWMEPVVVASQWRDSWSGGGDQIRVHTEFAAPMEALISLGNERLVRVGLKEDRLPERVGVFNEAKAGEAIGTYGPRSSCWEKYLKEAFARADAPACKTLLGWLGENARERFHPRDMGASPLGELSRAVGAPRERQEAALEVGLEQTAQWAAAWFDPRDKKTRDERAEQLKEQAMAKLLRMAAAKGNETLCQILLGKGAPISKKAMLAAAEAASPGVFWAMLAAARAEPERLKTGERYAAIASDRGGWMEREEAGDKKSEPALLSVAEGLAQSARRRWKDKERGGAWPSERGARRLMDFALAVFEEGAELPGEPKGSARGARRAAAAAMASLGSLMGEPKALDAVEAAEPVARPSEIAALFEMGEIERFKARALGLSRSKAVSKAGKAELEQALMECAEAVAAAELGRRGSRERLPRSERLGRQEPGAALRALAWLSVKAPNLVSSDTAALFIAEKSRLLEAARPDAEDREDRKSHFESLVIAEQIDQAAAPGGGSLALEASGVRRSWG